MQENCTQSIVLFHDPTNEENNDKQTKTQIWYTTDVPLIKDTKEKF